MKCLNLISCKELTIYIDLYLKPYFENFTLSRKSCSWFVCSARE
jgi:hypothetical protein